MQVETAGVEVDSVLFDNFSGRLCDRVLEQAGAWDADVLVLARMGGAASGGSCWAAMRSRSFVPRPSPCSSFALRRSQSLRTGRPASAVDAAVESRSPRTYVASSSGSNRRIPS